MPVVSPPSPTVERPRRLARYVDSHGALRELVLMLGARGSLLVVDRDSATSTDRRLVAHLAADEPAENAALICDRYLQDPAGRWCRRVSGEDLEVAPPGELLIEQDEGGGAGPEIAETVLSDVRGRRYRLELVWSGMSIPEQRWRRSRTDDEEAETLSVREVIGSLESYEPVMAITARAIALHRADPTVSIVALGSELERMSATRVVLNRGLRETVLAAIAREGLSMSEIAMRCGRLKRDSRGVASGETSWLGRRLGILPEGGMDAPTPWVHSEVLALIARNGLGVSPREVELG